MKPTIKKLSAVVIVSSTVTFVLHLYLINFSRNDESLVTSAREVAGLSHASHAKLGRRRHKGQPEVVVLHAAADTRAEDRQKRVAGKDSKGLSHALEHAAERGVQDSPAKQSAEQVYRGGNAKTNRSRFAGPADGNPDSKRLVASGKNWNGTVATNRTETKKSRYGGREAIPKSFNTTQQVKVRRVAGVAGTKDEVKSVKSLSVDKQTREGYQSDQKLNLSANASPKQKLKRDGTGAGTKYLIYLCDSKKPCGGWGDRQRGLVNAFLLATVTSRRFGINMTFPCDIGQFYQPKQVNWVISQEEIRGKSVRFLDAVDSGDFQKTLLTIDFNKAFPEEVVFLRTNVEHYWPIRGNVLYSKVLPPWAQHGRPEMFRRGWNILMNPTKHMQDHVHNMLQECSFFNKTSPLVCAHIRIGVSKSNPTDSEKRNDVKSLGPLWEFLGGYVRNGSHVFLATDSLEVRDHSKKLFSLSHHDTGGKIVHVDKQGGRKDACAGFEYALLDQLVLVNCDVLVTTNSMFGFRAALIRGTNKGLYHFDKGKMHTRPLH